MTIIDALLKDGPAWIIVGVLLTMFWQLTKVVIDVVKNNTEAVSKLTEIVSHCEKQKDK